MGDKKFIVPQGTKCIAYRRSHDEIGRPSIEKKEHETRQDNEFDEVLLSPQKYNEEPHKFPGNTYSVQLALRGYMIFSGESRRSNNRFFIAVPEDKVRIVDND